MGMRASCRNMEEIGHHKRQTNWRAVVPIVGVTWANACAKVEVVGVVVVRVWSRSCSKKLLRLKKVRELT